MSVPARAARPYSPRAAAWTFFRQWMRSPLAIASIVPSGRQLTRRMLDALPANPRGVVELGAGTGVFTEAVLKSGLAPERLLVVELNKEFHGMLQRRFPQVQVVSGDAAKLPEIAAQTGFGTEPPVDAMLSGLGLRAMPYALQKAILSGIFTVLAPGGVFVQFTYGRTGSLPARLLDELGVRSHRESVAWRNVPPASVHVYRRAAD